MSVRYDVVVVGAGHNGLTAAAILAKRGRAVLVTERRHLVGGTAAAEDVMEPPEALNHLAQAPERANASSCFGTPVIAGDRTVIPVAEVTYGVGFGFGAGGGESEEDSGSGGGGALSCSRSRANRTLRPSSSSSS